MSLEGRILVIDDDYDVRYDVMEILHEAGYEVVGASNAVEGLHLLVDTANFDAVLSDTLMPHMDGPQFLTEIHRRFPDLSVVILTEHGSIEAAVWAMRQGTANYLLKPISAEGLIEYIHEAVRLHREKRQKRTIMNQVISDLQCFAASAMINTEPEPLKRDDHALAPQDLVIDEDKVIALYQNIPLALSPTEFNILRCLVQAGGRVVSYQEMAFYLKHISIGPNEARILLSSHLANLRVKLAKAGCEHYLVNRRTVGYSIAAAS